MKALIQRVAHASVAVDGKAVGKIDQGLLVLLAVEKRDDAASADKLLKKILNYRVFADNEEKMNLSVLDVDGGVLIVSQFTLAADTNKGLRPSFSSAGGPELAERLYDYTVAQARQVTPKVATGIFAADMKVTLLNDGPVTFMLES
ncbi:MAG: D-tyrosyl-tRNA(Tyr) deacylase [Moraxellaceae bacterium]|nr:MAG: D-tyrosyl-tRNA(Tyr) deacylase [Moraxellaceae bacterium]